MTPPVWYKQLLCPLWPAWAKEVMPYRLAKMRERQAAIHAYLGVTPKPPPNPDGPPTLGERLAAPYSRRAFNRVWDWRLRRIIRYIKHV